MISTAAFFLSAFILKKKSLFRFRIYSTTISLHLTYFLYLSHGIKVHDHTSRIIHSGGITCFACDGSIFLYRQIAFRQYYQMPNQNGKFSIGLL